MKVRAASPRESNKRYHLPDEQVIGRNNRPQRYRCGNHQCPSDEFIHDTCHTKPLTLR